MQNSSRSELLENFVMDQRANEISEISETEKMRGDQIYETENIITHLQWSKSQDIFMTKVVEVVNKLEQLVRCLEKAAYNTRMEQEVWHAEREGQLKSQREMFRKWEETTKQMQSSLEQSRNTRPSSRASHNRFKCCEVSVTPREQVLPILRSELRAAILSNIRPVGSSRSSIGDEAENYEADDENDIELDEGGEADVEDAEEVEVVLEYTPVTSVMELPSLCGSKGGKRKASFLLGDEDCKRRRLSLVECPVCQAALPEIARDGKLLMVTKCGHVMCSNCAMRIWVQSARCCPQCSKSYDIRKLRPVYL